ncbi:carbohydrate sulfotransferase 9-like [Ruditapes philippinarum]|uniref:carbohydrate sulfotransferase 9-like n=1 Tax=Ruditapes philippinarum TaxID=129788 RepID=UPI00295B22DD|nr:carbohydrate sulfotransferase 9-like [Ruditapes philippinarum]
MPEPQPSYRERQYTIFQQDDNHNNSAESSVSDKLFYMKQHFKSTKGKFKNPHKEREQNNTMDDNVMSTRQDFVQFDRLQQFRNQCESYNLLTNNTNSDEGMKVLYSKQYRLAYRLVPKIGSTFMIQVYSILENNGKTGNLLNLPRSSIHNKRVDRFRKIISLSSLNTYTFLVMARNPYSRLYSAYIDKVYILNNLNLCSDIHSTLFRKKERMFLCKFDISFEQFLEYYLDKGGSVLSGHYNPILSHKIARKLCNLQNIIIVKQETFSEDMDHVFKSVHVKGKEYDVIYDVMHSKQTKITIGSIVKTVYQRFSSSLSLVTCLTWKEIAKKLWKSFQIQGYINEKSQFPEKKYQNLNDYKSDKYLIKVILQEVRRNPLSHEEKIKQRNEALIKAFTGVDKKYLRKIRELYAMDFNMFQYKTNLLQTLT